MTLFDYEGILAPHDQAVNRMIRCTKCCGIGDMYNMIFKKDCQHEYEWFYPNLAASYGDSFNEEKETKYYIFCNRCKIIIRSWNEIPHTGCAHLITHTSEEYPYPVYNEFLKNTPSKKEKPTREETMTITFIQENNENEELLYFKDVQINQFFVCHQDFLCQKHSASIAHIIAKHEGRPICDRYSEWNNDTKLVKRILPKIIKIEF